MSKSIAKSVQCRYLKRTNMIKSSNFEMNLDTLKALSYNWWVFCTKVNGLIILNNSSYSSSTHKHQSKALKVLNYETDLTLRYTRESLSNLEGALNSEIDGTRSEIRKLIASIRKPRSWKSTNLERRKDISKLLKHINKVQSTKKAVL